MPRAFYEAAESTAFRARARTVLASAIRCGTVKRQYKCEECGRKAQPHEKYLGIEAHHTDYAQPLMVQWLCHWCHRRADIALRNTYRRKWAASFLRILLWPASIGLGLDFPQLQQEIDQLRQGQRILVRRG